MLLFSASRTRIQQFALVVLTALAAIGSSRGQSSPGQPLPPPVPSQPASKPAPPAAAPGPPPSRLLLALKAKGLDHLLSDCRKARSVSEKRRLMARMVAAPPRPDGFDPALMGAVECGAPDLFEAMAPCGLPVHTAQAGADRFLSCDPNRCNVLMYAARSTDPVAIRVLLEALPAHPADRRRPRPWDEPLQGTIQHGPYLKTYLDDLCDNAGYTPLMHAAEAGNARMVHLLLALGADINKRNRANATALQLAIATGAPAAAAKEALQERTHLLERQADDLGSWVRTAVGIVLPITILPLWYQVVTRRKEESRRRDDHYEYWIRGIITDIRENELDRPASPEVIRDEALYVMSSTPFREWRRKSEPSFLKTVWNKLLIWFRLKPKPVFVGKSAEEQEKLLRNELQAKVDEVLRPQWGAEG